MITHSSQTVFSSEKPHDWRHLHVGDPVVYLEQEHLIVCVNPPNRTEKWSLTLAKREDDGYTVTVSYGHPYLIVFRAASY